MWLEFVLFMIFLRFFVFFEYHGIEPLEFLLHLGSQNYHIRTIP